MLVVGALFYVVAPAAASSATTRVDHVSPNQGPTAGGTTVTIAGENFIAVTGVSFGSRPADSFEVISPTEITAVTPPWASGNAIAEATVETASMSSVDSIEDHFTYEPTVTKIEPAYGAAAGGTTVTISGEAFEGYLRPGANLAAEFVHSVQFDSHEATHFKAGSEDTITAVSPPGTGTVDVRVDTGGGMSATSAADRFTYATLWPTGPPVIEGESVSHITSTDATLEAQINTEGLETSYEFHVVEETCVCLVIMPGEPRTYTLPAGRLLGSIVPQSVSADLNSAGVQLLPRRTYYWVTATNAAGTSEGAQHSFTPPEEEGPQPPRRMSPGGPTSQSDSPSSLTVASGHARKHDRRRHHRRHRHHGRPSKSHRGRAHKA